MPTFPRSTVSLSSVLDPLTKTTVDLARWIEEFRSVQRVDGQTLAIALDEVQSGFDSIANILRAASPQLLALRLDSADILSLIVGGPEGPGELTVLSGPPSYIRIGWAGTEPNGVVVDISSVTAGLATSVTAHGLSVGDTVIVVGNSNFTINGSWVVLTVPTSTTFTASGMLGDGKGGSLTRIIRVALTGITAGLGTTATAHSLVVGDIIQIAGSSLASQNGFFAVATVPTTTTFTATNLSGTGTGGTVTIQYAGSWWRAIRVGGTGPSTAPFYVDNNGNVFIGKNAFINAQGKEDSSVGWFGTRDSATVRTVTGASNATPIVITTSAAHGYSTGDRVTIAGVLGNTAANGNWIITVLTTTTFSLNGSVGNGAYTSGGTSTRYFNGAWLQELRVGGTNADTAQFIADANGNVRLVNGSISITSSAGDIITIDATNGLQIVNGVWSVKIFNASVLLDDTGASVRSLLSPGTLSVSAISGSLRGVLTIGSGGGSLEVRNNSGVTKGNLYVDALNGGQLDLTNLAGTLTANMFNASVTLKDSSGPDTQTLISPGSVSVRALNGSIRGVFSGSGSGPGSLDLRNTLGVNRALLRIGSDAGVLELKDTTNVIEAVLDAGSGFGELTLANAGFNGIKIRGSVSGSSNALQIDNSFATTASAGTSGAPPAQVAGYLVWLKAGATIKIPFYGA